MSDITFSYSLSSDSKPVAATDQLLSFNGVKVLPCVSNMVLLHHETSNRSMLVQQEVAQALTMCRHFRSLDQHITHISTAMPALREHPQNTRDVIKGVIDAGFLESSEQAWQRITSGTASTSPGPYRIFILTCDRPLPLQRLLADIAGSELDAAAESLWVIDDSKSAESMSKNAELVNSFKTQVPVPVHHVDIQMQSRLREHVLSACNQHTDSLDFLLSDAAYPGAKTYGRARNLALLLSVGVRSLILDDDIRLDAIAPPFEPSQLKTAAGADREAELYESPEVMMQRALKLDESPLKLMSRNLGKTLGDLVLEHCGQHAGLAGWDGDLLRNYHSQTRIVLSQCGTWGDPGTTDASWALYLPHASVTRLLNHSFSLQSAMAARSSWTGYRGPTLTQYGSMSQLTGLDHRVTLPPYFPVGRSEDALFGIMLHRLHPDSVVMNEGWSIHHAPLEAREKRSSLTPPNIAPNIHTFADWIGRDRYHGLEKTAGKQLALLSDELKLLYEGDTSSLEALVGLELSSKRASIIERCQTQLTHVANEAASPNGQEWQNYLMTTQNALVQALQKPEETPLADRLSSSGKTDISWLRKTGTQFAGSLDAWEEICSSAEGFQPKPAS